MLTGSIPIVLLLKCFQLLAPLGCIVRFLRTRPVNSVGVDDWEEPAACGMTEGLLRRAVMCSPCVGEEIGHLGGCAAGGESVQYVTEVGPRG